MHQVSAVRLGMKRHSTHAPSGQVSGSHENTVQYPPGWARSHWRSPVTEQSVELPQLSPICSLHPAPTRPARPASNKIIARPIVSGGAYGRHRTIANRSAREPMSVRFPPYCEVFGSGRGSYCSSALGRWPRMGSIVLHLWSELETRQVPSRRLSGSRKTIAARMPFATSRVDCFSRSADLATRWKSSHVSPRRSRSRCAMIRYADGRPPRRNADTARRRGRCCWASRRVRSW